MTLSGVVAVLLALAMPAAAACDPARFRVALDIGHSRANPGSTSARGVPEYEYNLQLARQVSAGLTGAGFTAQTMIGAMGVAIGLLDRTALAKQSGAQLFLSLHHDSVQPQYLQAWDVQGTPQRYTDRFSGHSVFMSALNVQAAASQQFAVLLGEALRRQGMTPSLHHAEPIPGEGRPLLDARLGLFRFDGLAVLRTAAMPAVLLEAAIIVNPVDEQRVRSGEVSRQVSAAVTAAVRQFCDVGGGASSPSPSGRRSG